MRPNQGATDELRCDFCALPRTSDRRLVAGPGIFICGSCVATASILLDAGRNADVPELKPRLETMADAELLSYLPEIAAVGSQVEKRLGEWVDIARQRGISWARIGQSLGMTRQSAWERFSNPPAR